MLNFIYYPVSFILWVWHKVFGSVLGDSNGFAWALSVVFLVFTLRAILYKPFVGQVRSMRTMQQMQPEMQKLRKKYANDRQKLAAEMQKLQQQNGANPIMGCLPALVQIPVFIGLFHVLREFSPLNNNGTPRTENYFFDQQGVQSFIDSNLLGAKLGAAIHPLSSFGGANVSTVEMLGGNYLYQWLVMVPLMIAAGVFTHITARHSVARQQALQTGAMDNTQQAVMQKLMLYVFPIGVVVGAPFLPLAILFYWVSNNLWTLGQQYLVYKKIDVEEAAKRDKATEAARSSAPRPGQKPVRPAAKSADADATSESPVTDETVDADETSNGKSVVATNGAHGDGTPSDGAVSNGRANGRAGANGSSAGGGASVNGGSSNGEAPKKKPGAKPVTAGGSSGKRPQSGGSGNRSKSGSRPSGSKRNKRR